MGCSGEDMESLWQCFINRSGNLKYLALRDVNVLYGDIPDIEALLAAKSEQLEMITFETGELSTKWDLEDYGYWALENANLPNLESLKIRPFTETHGDVLGNSPWLQNVRELTLRDPTRDGLAAIFRGASGGQLRELTVNMYDKLTNTIFDAFSDADLPALTTFRVEADVSDGRPWDASHLLTSTLLPRLETLELQGWLQNISIPQGFADQSVLPSLKHLELYFYLVDHASAVALGKRLPTLRSFEIGSFEKFEDMNISVLLETAGEYSDEWVTTSIKISNNTPTDMQADLPILDTQSTLAPRMAALKSLSFDGNVGVVGARLWAWAAQRELWPQLEKLDIGKVRLEGLKALAGFLPGRWENFCQDAELTVQDAGRNPAFDAAVAFPGVKLCSW